MAANNIPLYETLTGVPANSLSHMELMVGRPHNYLQNTDPGARTFIRHMLQDAPLIMIRPGRVAYTDDTSKLISQIQNSLGLKSTEEAEAFVEGVSPIYSKETGYGVSETDQNAIKDAIARKERGSVHNYETKDSSAALRYFEFQPALSDYISVLATLSSRLYSRLKGPSVATLNSMTPDLAYGGAYTFWADNASSVSESASAEVGETALAGIVKQVSNLSRQAQFFLGDNFQTKEAQDGAVKSAMQSISDTLGGADVSGVRASLGAAVLGMNPMFPEIWKDSSFGRSYNLSFKFHSPYGDAASVYQNVLQPFAMLLALVLPVLRTPATYSEPFVFQLDCPGRFACDLGICTDFSFVKGGSEGLWTDQGLPRAIDVTMTVKDLYPVLAASQNNQSMYMNIGMGTFLDNLAGINLLQRNAGQGDVLQRLHAGVNSALQQGAAIPDLVESRIQILGEQSGIAAGMRGVGALFGSGN